MVKKVPPKSVMETILEWSGRRPFWQRDALRRIVVDGTPDSGALVEIKLLCKKEHGARAEPGQVESGTIPTALEI